MKQTTIQLLAANETQLAKAREIKANKHITRISERWGAPPKLLEARRPSMPEGETMTALEDKLRKNWERDHSRSPRAKRARDEDTDKTKEPDIDHEIGQ